MAWRDNLRPGSFRGAPFFIETGEGEGGRETISHRFPGKDDGFVEDMGRKPRKFSIDCFCIGPEYMAARDALLTALEGEGPGKLVHPYMGEFTCAAGDFKWRESAAEGGMVRFSIQFETTPAQAPQPSSVADAPGALAAATDTGLGALSADFLSAFKIGGQPQFALDSLTQISRDATTALDQAFAPIIDGAQQLASFKRQVTQLYSTAEDLIRAPEQLANSVLLTLGLAPTYARAPEDAVRGLVAVYDFSSEVPPAPATTPTRVQEGQNQAAISGLWRRAAIMEAARACITTDFVSYDDAVAVRGAILDRLDAELDTASDALFQPLLNLKGAIVAAVPGEERELARIVSVTPTAQTTSLALAFQLFGDIKSEADIVARNRIRHPGFVPAQVPVQVLSRV